MKCIDVEPEQPLCVTKCGRFGLFGAHGGTQFIDADRMERDGDIVVLKDFDCNLIAVIHLAPGQRVEKETR